MSLKKLKTNNFYAIKSKEVEFSPQVTTIVGKSAAGKSSFIRSLKWIALNKPTGLRFIHWGTKQASTALKVSKKPTITRTRSKSDNLYQLGKKDFRSFKNDVPKDIADVLNIGELNFQSQHAPHFWFSLTSGEVARELNKIINLEIIDVASSRIASKVRETKATITVIENRLSNLQQQKEQLRWVKSLDKVLQRVEKLEKRLDDYEIQKEGLTSITKSIKSATSKINTYRKINKNGKKFLKLTSRLDSTLSRKKLLTSIIKKAEEYQEALNIKIPDITKLETILQEQISKQRQRGVLWGLIEMIKTQKEMANQWKKEKEADQKKLKKESQGRCPLCQQMIK